MCCYPALMSSPLQRPTNSHQIYQHQPSYLLPFCTVMADFTPPTDAPPSDVLSRSRRRHIPIVLAPPPLLPRLFTPRSFFFSIPLRSPAHESSPITPIQLLTGTYLAAIDRVNNAPERDGTNLGLDHDQRTALSALLTVLNDYHASNPLTIPLTAEIAANTDVIALANYGNLIHRGLAAFQSKNAPGSFAASSTLVDSAASRHSPYPNAHQRRGGSRHTSRHSTRSSASHSGASASPSGTSTLSLRESTPNDLATLSEPSSSSRASRSTSVRASCRLRDTEQCRICSGGRVISAHIIPFSLRSSKALDFWSLVSLFRGRDATAELKSYALEPDATDADNILNVLCLCPNCHDLFDHAALTLVPDLDTLAFPFSPWGTRTYDVSVEFTGGCSRAIRVLAETDAGDPYRVMPGHRISWVTGDPEQSPLPHPLLLQLHTVCTRIAKLRAAAGWRSERGGRSDGQTEWEEVEDVQLDDAGEDGGVGVREEKPREWRADVVAEELRKREVERGMLWAKKMERTDMETQDGARSVL